MLLWDGEPVWKLPLEERRARVEALDGFRISPCTSDADDAARLARRRSRRWASTACREAARAALPARLARGRREGEGGGTADCVVVGASLEGRAARRSRPCCSASTATTAGSTTSAPCSGRRDAHDEIAERVQPLLKDAPDRRFSEPNRWGTGELEEAALRPELVAEVRYDKVQGNRFRHGTKFLRLRPRQGSRRVHVGAGAPAAQAGDPTIDSLLGELSLFKS